MSLVVCGIDYSMTSPAVTVAVLSEDGTIDPKKCSFHYLTNKKKLQGMFFNNVFGHEYPSYTSQEERFDIVSNWALSVVKNARYVFIEDYAFAAKGKVFHIGENTGLLKHKLFKAGIAFETMVPTQIKQMATGKGNAKKGDMYDAFVTDTGIKFTDIDSKPEGNPISDMVDSYWITKTGLQRILDER